MPNTNANNWARRCWDRRRPRLPGQLGDLVRQQQARTPALPVLALPAPALPILFAALILSTASCQREQRQFEPQPPNSTNISVTMSDLRPGASQPPAQTKNPAEEHAYDVNEGKRLYSQYNCSGCHFNGGGGIGPPLMDEKWVYGSESENIYSTIVEGRPNGMPSFRQKIPDYQVWELAAYVKTLSSQLRKDIEPGRTDDLNPHNSEQRSERKKPQDSNQPPSTQQP